MKNTFQMAVRQAAGLDEAACLKDLPHEVKLKAFWSAIIPLIKEQYRTYDAEAKKVAYATMEILTGRTISNNLLNLPNASEILKLMEECGVGLNELEEMEEEPKTGNGGLGRLGACMIESAATHGVNLDVHTVRYRNGLFKQKIVKGKQQAEDDVWLDENGRYPFEVEHPEDMVVVLYREGSRDVRVQAIPCDMPVIGAVFDPAQMPYTNYIRMWKVGKVYANGADDSIYKKIDKRLYPDDTKPEGKKLRLMQEYFLSAAIVHNALKKLRDHNWTISSLPDHWVLHINDTHPVLMIPEMMKVLRRQYGMSFVRALEICRKLFCYTNHTIMAEALEQWDIDMVESMLPDVYEQIHDLHRSFESEIRWKYPGDMERLAAMDILWGGKVRMANLAIYVSQKVNGVASIHTEILRNRELKYFNEFFPGKICNVTNGITQRRFVGHASPALAALNDRLTGSPLWRTDYDRIRLIDQYADDPEVQKAYAAVHLHSKERLSQYVKELIGIDIPAHFMFDVQIKRIHEYKRQQMNCLKIISLYQQLKEKLEKNEEVKFNPCVFIFSGKAAETYEMANKVVELINKLQKLINNDPAVNKLMRVVFIPNYNVTKAEYIMPAVDCSEQISTASREASGTGNMKCAALGAVTIGTMDGANVEIREAVGDDNIFIFGLTKEEVMRYEANSGSYISCDELTRSERLRNAVNALRDGSLWDEDDEPCDFSDLVNEWCYGENGNMPDRFFVLKDFDDYMNTFMQVNEAYGDFSRWNRMCLKNIAGSAYFSSDRMVREYAEKIWKL